MIPKPHRGFAAARLENHCTSLDISEPSMRYFVCCSTLLAIALVAVCAVGQEPDVAKLTAALESKDAQTRAKAADDLAQAGESAKAALPALIKALSDDSKEVRWRAARTLGGFGAGAESAVVPLIKALSDPDSQVKAYAAFALGAIGEKARSAAPALLKIAPDKDELVRRAALGALRKIKPPREVTRPLFIEMLEHTNPTLITAMMRTFAEAGEEAVPVLSEALAEKKTAYWAALALREIGPKAKVAVTPLVEVLKKNDEPEVRMQAALALGAIGPGAKGAVPALAMALDKDEFAGAKFASAYALGMIRSKEGAIESLEGAAKSDDQFLALVSSWSLAQLEPEKKGRSEQAAKLIIAGLKSKDTKLRSVAARAMAELKGQSTAVAPALIAALKDADPEVVGNAIDALAAGGKDVVPAVAVGLGNKDLRLFAVRILGRIGADSKAAVPALIKALSVDDVEFKREVHFTLGIIGPDSAPAVPELMKSLSSDEELIRNSAIFALGKIGPAAKDALPALRKNVTSEDRMLKRVSVWAMLKIDRGNERLSRLAVPLLAEGLGHEMEMVRYEAAVALGEIGDLAKPALPALKQALEDKSAHVRDAAAEALKRIEK